MRPSQGVLNLTRVIPLMPPACNDIIGLWFDDGPLTLPLGDATVCAELDLTTENCKARFRKT